jgi:hypothetical protein
VWPDATAFEARVDAVAHHIAMRKVLDAVNSLEHRVLALEGTPFTP